MRVRIDGFERFWLIRALASCVGRKLVITWALLDMPPLGTGRNMSRETSQHTLKGEGNIREIWLMGVREI